MSYTPNTWANGDTITAAKLNNNETGISVVDAAKLPTAPTIDGTYTLKVTVLNGVATVAWVSDAND